MIRAILARQFVLSQNIHRLSPIAYPRHALQAAVGLP
jgi:hypothetical protein